MVILHVKRPDANNQFRYETTLNVQGEDVIKEIVLIHNLRLKIQALANAIKELAQFGPLRSEDCRGLSLEAYNGDPSHYHMLGTPTNPDSSNYRYGVPPPAQVSNMMLKTSDQALEAVSHKKAEMRICLQLEQLEEQLSLLKGALTIAYPDNHNLPEWDSTRRILDDLQGKEEYLKEEETALWWAGKEVRRDKPLKETIGSNEKTTVVVKLQLKGQGAPVREPRVDEETHKAMLAYYYKKENEAKRLMEDEDDSYLASEWCNPKGLKNQLHGGASIKWRMGN